ncbi:MAG: ATP synthase F1 subunit epsilon [Treponema sp.]|nr:ATP synthase F1 subunit epsilon [Treponema sp.]
MAIMFPLEIHTPYRLFFSDSVLAFSLTLIDGEIAVYANHVPFTAPVIPCILRIKDKDEVWKTAFISEGILEVGEQKAILISDDAEWPDEINYERAIASKERAEQTLEHIMLKFEKTTALSALQRANARIKVYEQADKKK